MSQVLSQLAAPETCDSGAHEERNASYGKMIELRIVESDFVEKPEGWVNHRRSKNYIARLTGLSRKYGFEREFLEKQRVGRETFFLKADFIEREIYEIKCIYYSARGNPNTHLEGFFQCVSVEDERIVLGEVSEETALQVVRQIHAEQVRAFEEEVETARSIDEVADARERIEEAREIREVMKEAKEELERKVPQIDEEEVREVRERLQKAIVEISKRLVLTGSQKYGVRKFVSDKIEIKEVDGELSWVKVDGTYVVSQYNNEVGLRALFNAYKLLKPKEAEKVEEINQLKEELK